jgi:myb proto-oncogene protein
MMKEKIRKKNMVAISLYRGNLHRSPDVPRRWLMPNPKISLKDFKSLLARRSKALSSTTTTSSNPNPNPNLLDDAPSSINNNQQLQLQISNQPELLHGSDSLTVVDALEIPSNQSPLPPPVVDAATSMENQPLTVTF